MRLIDRKIFDRMHLLAFTNIRLRKNNVKITCEVRRTTYDKDGLCCVACYVLFGEKCYSIILKQRGSISQPPDETDQFDVRQRTHMDLGVDDDEAIDALVGKLVSMLFLEVHDNGNGVQKVKIQMFHKSTTDAIIN